MQSTFEPAWAYHRNGWSVKTGLEWIGTKHGDELRLWLPPDMVGIRIHDAQALEALAWQEERVRAKLRRYWMTRPGNAPYGVMVMRCNPAAQMQSTITTGVTVECGNIPVWPSPAEDGQRWTWYDPNGVPLLGAPPEREILSIPKEWADELTLTRDLDPERPWTIDDSLKQFIAQTFVPNGWEHRLTSEEIFSLFERWCDSAKVHENYRIAKVALARWISESTEFHKWAGRTKVGYRRGFTGLRLPDGSWNG